MGIQVIHHPTGHVEVNHSDPMPSPMPGASMQGMPAQAPAPPAQGGGFGGMAADPMASGMKSAMDGALASGSPGAKEPIQKPDATRGGSESNDSKKPTPKDVGKKPAGGKTAAKGAKTAPKGGAAKKTENTKGK